MSGRPIGIFDSGYGGLTVLYEVRKALPNESLLYFGDSRNAPYGRYSEQECIEKAAACAEVLLAQGAKALVVACNLMSGLALAQLRRRFTCPIVGVIDAGAQEVNRLCPEKGARVGVMGAPVLMRSGVYAAAINVLRPDIVIRSVGADSLVPIVEKGAANTPEADREVSRYLREFKDFELDGLVLGCTHYPLLAASFRKVLGDAVPLIDPARNTALHLQRILENRGLARAPGDRAYTRYFTSGDTRAFGRFINAAFRINIPHVEHMDAGRQEQLMPRATKTIPCVFMRTGTSKSAFFHKRDIPEDAALRDAYLLAAMGSPDLRQIDGLGGGDVSTSKIAIIAKADSPDYDIEYTFGQVSLTDAKIDYAGNCGNCSSGVGPFAVDEGLVQATDPVTTVRIFNTNTRRLLIEHVRTRNGKAVVEGDCEIDGVPGAWAPIDLDFRDTVGATTGRLFPTGSRTDTLEVPGVGAVPVTIADLGNPVVFFPAASVGASGYEPRPAINANAELLARVEAVRQSAAEKIGLVKAGEVAKKVSAMKPLVVMFAPAKDYADYVSGSPICRADIDFVAKNIMNQLCIDTFAATAALCTGVVARSPGTVLHAVASASVRAGRKHIVAIGQSRGISEAEVDVMEKDGEIVVEKAVMQRTARRIMKGDVYIEVATA